MPDNNESQTSARTPRYSLVTQTNTPAMLSKMFELIESRYVRRERYIRDVTALVDEIDRLNLLNDYTPFIDTSGNICFRIPEDAVLTVTDAEHPNDGMLYINNAGELILNYDDSDTAKALAQMRFHISDTTGDLIVTQVDPEDGV